MFGAGLVPLVLLVLQPDFKIILHSVARQTGKLRIFAFETLCTSSGILELCVCVFSVCAGMYVNVKIMCVCM